MPRIRGPRPDWPGVGWNDVRCEKSIAYVCRNDNDEDLFNPNTLLYGIVVLSIMILIAGYREIQVRRMLVQQHGYTVK